MAERTSQENCDVASISRCQCCFRPHGLCGLRSSTDVYAARFRHSIRQHHHRPGDVPHKRQRNCYFHHGCAIRDSEPRLLRLRYGSSFQRLLVDTTNPRLDLNSSSHALDRQYHRQLQRNCCGELEQRNQHCFIHERDLRSQLSTMYIYRKYPRSWPSASVKAHRTSRYPSFLNGWRVNDYFWSYLLVVSKKTAAKRRSSNHPLPIIMSA